MREDRELMEWATYEALRDALTAKDDPEEFVRRMEAVSGFFRGAGMGSPDAGDEDVTEALNRLLELTRQGNETAARYLQDLVSENPCLHDFLKL